MKEVISLGVGDGGEGVGGGFLDGRGDVVGKDLECNVKWYWLRGRKGFCEK